MAEGSQSLDPSSFIDTSAWVSDFGFDSHEHKQQQAQKTAPEPAREKAPPKEPSKAGQDDLESLSQMLEPDRTGVHDTRKGGRGVMIAVLVIVLLLAALGAGAFVFKDKLFGGGGEGAQAPAPPSLIDHG
jgi:hypothetical protein